MCMKKKQEKVPRYKGLLEQLKHSSSSDSYCYTGKFSKTELRKMLIEKAEQMITKKERVTKVTLS